MLELSVEDVTCERELSGGAAFVLSRIACGQRLGGLLEHHY
jgi:hypothetical protein